MNLEIRKSRVASQQVQISTDYDTSKDVVLGSVVEVEEPRYGWTGTNSRLFRIVEINDANDGRVTLIGQRHSNEVFGGMDTFPTVQANTDVPTLSDYSLALDNFARTQTGQDGMSSAIVRYYQRTLINVPPVLPTVQSTFTFTNPTVLTPATNNGWSAVPPTEIDTSYLWATEVSVSVASNTVNIQASEWSQPFLLGSPGGQGNPGSTPVPYYSANPLNSQPTTLPPSSEWVLDEDLVVGTAYNWIIWGTEAGGGRPSIYTFTASGEGGAVTVTTPASSSTGTITINPNATTGVGDAGNPETLTLTVTGDTGSSTTEDLRTFTMASGDVEMFQLVTPEADLEPGGVTGTYSLSYNGTSSAFSGTFGREIGVGLPRQGYSDIDSFFTDYAAQLPRTVSHTNFFRFVLSNPRRVNGELITDVTVTSLAQAGSTSTLSDLRPFNSGANVIRTLSRSTVFRRSATPSQVRIATGSIDETLTLSPSLTTQATIAADIVSMFNANANLRSIFNAATANASNQVVFSTIANSDIDVVVEYIDNSGDITGATTVVNGVAGTYVLPSIRLTLPEATEDLMLASGQNAETILGLVETEMEMHGYTGNRVNNVYTYTRTATGPSAAPSLAVTAGSSSLSNSTFTVAHTSGTNAVTTGTDGTLNLRIGTTTQSLSIAGQSATQIIDTIRTAINLDGTFLATEPTPTSIRATSVTNQNIDLAVTVDRTLDPSGTAAVARQITQTGQAPSFTFAAIQQLRGDSGAAGRFRLDVFRLATSPPSEPSGGTQATAPTGWSFTPSTPGSGQTLYQSFVVVDPATDTTTTNFGTRWSSVFVAGSQGPAGADGVSTQIRFIYHSNARTIQPTLPSSTNNVNNGWNTGANTNDPWFAHQINDRAPDGTITSFGPWVGPFLTRGADGVNPSVTDNGNGTYTVRDGNGNVVTITDGEDGQTGATGSSVDLIFIRSSSQPATPSASSGVPSGWFATTNAVPSGSNPIWSSVGTRAVGASNFVWQSPVRTEGVDGANGTPGANGTILYAYRRSSSTPPGPSNNVTYTFANGSFSTSLGNSWVTGSPPTGTDPLYIVTTNVSSASTSTSITSSSWSSPQLWVMNGAAGQDGNPGTSVASVEAWLATTTATAPTSRPSTTRIFTFSTGSWNDDRLGNGWNTQLSNVSGNYIWSLSAVATSTSSTDSVASSDWSTTPVLRVAPGGDGPTGARGAGRWNVRVGTSVASSYSQTQLNSFLASIVPGSDGDSPVNGDQLWLFSSASSTNLEVTGQLVYLYNNGWVIQAEAIDGDLLVGGTVTADAIATGTITANEIATGTITSDELAANSVTANEIDVDNLAAISADLGTITAGSISADLITAGTLNGENINVTNLNADNITTGNLRAENISLGAGIVNTGGSISVSTDGTSLVINENGQLETVTPQTVINTVSFTGGQTGRTYTYNRGDYTDVTSSGVFGGGRDLQRLTFFWRYDMLPLGQAQYQALTGLTLNNFDVQLTYRAGSAPSRASILEWDDARFDLWYDTSTGTTTGQSTVRRYFDGRISTGPRDVTVLSGGTATISMNGTFSTIGTQFPAPFGGGRFLVLGFDSFIDGVLAGFTSNEDFEDLTITIPAQSDTTMTLHFENGTSITTPFNNHFL